MAIYILSSVIIRLWMKCVFHTSRYSLCRFSLFHPLYPILFDICNVFQQFQRVCLLLFGKITWKLAGRFHLCSLEPLVSSQRNLITQWRSLQQHRPVDLSTREPHNLPLGVLIIGPSQLMTLWSATYMLLSTQLQRSMARGK